MKHRQIKLLAASVFLALSVVSEIAQAAGVLTIGRREDSTTFDPIKSAQNADNWVFSNVFDPLVRVDKSGTKLEPGVPRAGRFPRMAKSIPSKFAKPGSRTVRR